MGGRSKKLSLVSVAVTFASSRNGGTLLRRARVVSGRLVSWGEKLIWIEGEFK